MDLLDAIVPFVALLALAILAIWGLTDDGSGPWGKPPSGFGCAACGCREREGERKMKEQSNVLLIGEDPDRLTPLRGALRRSARVVWAEDLPQALEWLAREDCHAVFADWRFHCGTWQDAVRQIGELYPHLPVIVLGPPAAAGSDAPEWGEVLAAGAFDLLLTPGDEFAAQAVLEHAVASGEARALRAIA